MASLFGSDFEIDLNPKNSVQNLINKITASGNNVTAADDAAVTKVLKSSELTLQDRLILINDRVLKILGKQKQNIEVIRDLDSFNRYIDSAISTGYIAIDTETNNSLDPATCKLMGLCLYAPGIKQAYVPINHVDPFTREKLINQLTEKDCHNGLQRILDSKTFIIMHNGKFDYEVIKATCHIDVAPDWDTIIAARLLNENELASLKEQYISKIDSTQSKYAIDKLFKNVPYAVVDPDIFALYAATDSLMTYKLYEWQYPYMTSKENEKLYWLFKNIEMPIVKVTAEMELRGVKIDVAFGEKLRLKYNAELERVDKEISDELKEADSIIKKWSRSKEAAEPSRVYAPKKSKKSLVQIEAEFNNKDKDGKRYKFGKSNIDLLDNPINLASPIQLAILFYDILGERPVNRKAPRATGEEELEAIAKRIGEDEDIDRAFKSLHIKQDGKTGYAEVLDTEEEIRLKSKVSEKLCKLILERRGIVKLITGYIDTIPALAKHWPDGRIRFKLNSLGTDTGRYSSGGEFKFLEGDEQQELSGINIQNIPSHGDGAATRMLFCGDIKNHAREEAGDGGFEIPEIDEVETTDGWKFVGELTVKDKVIIDEKPVDIVSIEFNAMNKVYTIVVKEGGDAIYE